MERRVLPPQVQGLGSLGWHVRTPPRTLSYTLFEKLYTLSYSIAVYVRVRCIRAVRLYVLLLLLQQLALTSVCMYFINLLAVCAGSS